MKMVSYIHRTVLEYYSGDTDEDAFGKYQTSPSTIKHVTFIIVVCLLIAVTGNFPCKDV
jgi:hypothetical protein